MESKWHTTTLPYSSAINHAGGKGMLEVALMIGRTTMHSMAATGVNKVGYTPRYY
jgi:hypothetical protein